MEQETGNDKGYWRANMRLVGILMAIWALVSFGFGIILRPLLDQIPRAVQFCWDDGCVPVIRVCAGLPV